jgi:hypothetical protein
MTEICLKTYIDTRITEVKEALRLSQEVRNAKISAVEAAIKEATRLMELRLEGMNEIRKQLEYQAGTFINIGEYRAQHKSLEDKVEELIKLAGTHVTRSELLAITSLISALVSSAVMIILHILGLK